MPYQFYNLLHILGIILVFMAFGGWALHGINGGTRESNKGRALLAATHGVGLLMILVAGFGMLARVHPFALGLPGWLHPKLLVWVLFGAAPMLLIRKPQWAKAMWILLPLLAGVSAYFGINHTNPSSDATSQESRTE